jgi:predicted proteasome-type protease
MISTARANPSVGPPYELAIYRNGSLELEEGTSKQGHRCWVSSSNGGPPS